MTFGIMMGRKMTTRVDITARTRRSSLTPPAQVRVASSLLRTRRVEGAVPIWKGVSTRTGVRAGGQDFVTRGV
jgi:hypothetical protein